MYKIRIILNIKGGSNMDQTAFFKLSYGLYIISTTSEGKDAGCVANTLHQVTSSPAQLAVTLNKDNYTEQLIEKSGRFSAVVLTQNCGMDIIKNFGFCSSRDNDKFAQCTYRRDTHGVPYPSEHMAARYSLKVVKTLDLGTHVMFVGEVEEAELLSEEEVMTYAYYHQVKNGATPKNAPSYQEKSEKSGWRCTICGYIYEGDPLPQDYVCPLCGAPAALFEKL